MRATDRTRFTDGQSIIDTATAEIMAKDAYDNKDRNVRPETETKTKMACVRFRLKVAANFRFRFGFGPN